MFQKILIANRGEVALRIIRACKELSVKTVLVHSEADAYSLPVRLADEAICIGPAESRESYLNIPSIISAAEITDVEAIHPGYGFLAEDAHFAEICRSCNIEFIGPTPETIFMMGDKSAAKKKMSELGIPVIPGSPGRVSTKEEALEIAKEVGYPVIVKAVFGGGGRGMRVAHNDISLASAMMTAKSEAEKAFGNGDVYIEKFVEAPRHIEVQILADQHGNFVHFGERDCTVQRRHQKLVEESPSPMVDDKLREKLRKTSVDVARAVQYVNAGTVEFLMDKDGTFYFMEMNTRIQVEHPVTEMISGIDLVKEQIRIASGERLSFSQADVRLEGAVMECRINAEDSANGFMPSPGKLTEFIVPAGPGVRVDSHCYTGYTIPTQYDSLIAKLIVSGKDRAEVLMRMKRALDEFIISGVKTTIPFHRELMDMFQFKKGEIDTNFIDNIWGEKGVGFGSQKKS